MSAEDEVLAGLPETPAGGQLAWLLGMIADEGAGACPSDLDRYDPPLREALGDFQDAAGLRDALSRLAGRLGAPLGVSVERSSNHEIAVVLATVGAVLVFTSPTFALLRKR